MDVFDFLVPQVRTLSVSGIVGEKFGVVFKMRAATGCIGDDGVELFRRELIDLFAGQALREFPFAVVGVKRAAALLVWRRDDFAAVAGQGFGGVAIYVRENEVLRAA